MKRPKKQKQKRQTTLTVQLEMINQKILTKEKRLKRYRDWVKQFKEDRIFQNNEKKKFYQKVGEECTRTNQQPDAKETKQFWCKIWEQNEYNRTTEWINRMKKELPKLEEDLEPEIYLESFRATLKKILNWKTPGNEDKHGFWF